MSNKEPKKPSMDESSEDSIVLRLEWGSADELETIFVNHMNINHSGPQFYVVFGELIAPLFIEKEEIPESVTIKPKVRIAIPHEAMVAFIEALNKNVGHFLEKRGEFGDNVSNS